MLSNPSTRSFYAIINLQADQRQGKSGNSGKSCFQIKENQGKWTFLEKIREKSGIFITNQGKNQGISLQHLFVILIFLKKFRSRLRFSLIIDISLKVVCRAVGDQIQQILVNSNTDNSNYRLIRTDSFGPAKFSHLTQCKSSN